MNRFADEDLERLLRLRPAPLPPAQLAARIKAETPRRIEVGLFHEAEPPGGLLAAAGIGRLSRVMGVAAAALVATAALALFAISLLHGGTEGEVRTVSLVNGDQARALIRVEAVSEPTAAETAALGKVAIEVAVVGPDRLPRAGERVAVEPVSPSGRPLELLTDRRGWARVAGLAPGTYRLRCDRGSGSDEVTLHPGERAALLLPVSAAWVPPTPTG